MPFQIPNYADAAFPAQASPDSGDLSILAAGHGLTGVTSGCAASVTGADLNVTIAAGVVIIGSRDVIVASGTVAIGAGNATNPRFDLIVANTSGTKSVVAGIAAANPVFPAIPGASIVLHAVYVPANNATVQSNQIVDKRVAILRDDTYLAYVWF